MQNVTDLWHQPFLWNTVGDWVIASAVFLATFTILPLIRGFVSARRKKWIASNRELPVAIELPLLLIASTSRIFLLTTALYLASIPLEFPKRISLALEWAIVLTFWYQFGRWAMAAARFAINRRAQRAGGPDATLSGSLDIIMFIAGIVIWAMALLLALDNLGIEIKPLLAGLGIGGIAVALAVQTVLGDLLASMSIALDKPFQVGDALQVDDINGTVEHIGVKSTRLRSLSGEQVIMSNADILKSRVRNNGRMRERRAAFFLNVVYDTKADQLRAIPGVVKEIVEKQKEARFDRCHLLTFADWALRYEVVFYMSTPNYGTYADAQQAINLAIVERFEEMGIEFATPTRPLFTPEAKRASA
jgi:small-conductance mechanosensitive channel